MKAKITLIILLISISFSFSQKKWSLQECVDYALENNLTIQRTKLTNQLTNEDLSIAQKNYLPSVSGSASQNINAGSNFNPVTNSRNNSTTRSNRFSVNASMTLFNGFNIKNRLKKAEKNNLINAFDLEKLEDDISLSIVNSYLNILFNKENLKVTEATLEITEKLLNRTNQLVDAGVQPRGNLLEIEATKANDENAIVIAQNNIDLALLTLAQTLQIPFEGFDVQAIEINLNSLDFKYDNTESIFEIAVQNQPNIKSSLLSIENSEIDIKIAKAEFLPTVSLDANLSTLYSHTNGTDDDFFIPNPEIIPFPEIPTADDFVLVKNQFFDQLDNNLGEFIGLSVRIPIFNKGITKINVNKAKIRQEITKTNLEDEKRALRENIERAYINAKATLKEYEAAKKSLESQELSFKFAEERYKLGATNSFDFEQVKNRLVSAKSAVINAKYNFVFRTKLLEFYSGIPIVIE